MAEWVNPEYLAPSMVDQCATAFEENGSTIQLHRFLKVPYVHEWCSMAGVLSKERRMRFAGTRKMMRWKVITVNEQ